MTVAFGKKGFYTSYKLTMHMGPDFILVNLSVDFQDTIVAGDVESLIASLDVAIKQQFPTVKRVFIEAEARKTFK